MKNAENKDKILLRQGLSFYGKITASLSHELNNAMAIINEHNGLLDDILLGARQGMPIDDKKLQKISTKISAQLTRAKELIKRLNKFAHSSDNEFVEFELTETVEAIIDIAQRLAGLKGMHLEFKSPGQKINISNNPFYIQYAVFACLELFMAAADEGRLIETRVEKKADAIAISITGPGLQDNDLTAARKNVLDLLMHQIDGSLQVRHETDQKLSMIISLKGKA